MGLAEYIRLGASLKRELITVQTDSTGSGSIELGSAYALLGITTDVPCRVRIYDDEASRDVTAEKNRPFGNTNVAASTALIGDFSMSAAGAYTIDPAVYGVVKNASSKLTYYIINTTPSAAYPKITFNRYLMENSSISTNSRELLPTIAHSLAPNNYGIGVIQSSTIPRTYLLVSASVSGSSSVARLRLYSTSQSLVDTTEISRSFTTESAAGSKLIVDAILSGSEITYFTPKIFGANLNTMGTDLNAIRNNTEKIMGSNELYYILQNAASSGPAAPISVSLHIFSLED